MMRSLSSRKARAAAIELHSSGGLGSSSPVEASRALKCTRNGEPARGAIHWNCPSAAAVTRWRCASGCSGAHDDGQRIVEQVFLHHVGRGRRIAQGADEDVGLAGAQSREQVLIGSIDDRDAVPRMLLRELEQRGRQ